MPSIGQLARGAASRLLAVCVILGLAAASYIGVTVARASIHPPARPTAKPPAPVNPIPQGKHLVAFVVIAAECGWSSRPDVKQAIGHLRQALHDAHGRDFAQISVVAVDVDKDVATGLDFLRSIQKGFDHPVFDQISVGGIWMNDAFLNIGWREHLASGAMPQVLLVARDVDSHDYLSAGKIAVGSDSMLFKALGNPDIIRWIQQGTPITSPSATVSLRVPSNSRSGVNDP